MKRNERVLRAVGRDFRSLNCTARRPRYLPTLPHSTCRTQLVERVTMPITAREGVRRCKHQGARSRGGSRSVFSAPGAHVRRIGLRGRAVFCPRKAGYDYKVKLGGGERR